MRMDVAAGKKSLRYKILSRGKIKEYQFEYVADEALKLPIGTVNTVKYKRAGNRGSRETLVWLSKDHDYVLARLWQSEDGKEQADLKLATFKFLEPSIPSL